MANHEQVSYRTINRFRSQETTAHLLAEAFVLLRRKLIINQVIDNEAIFIDGTKDEADANKFSFVWRKATNHYEAALDKQSIGRNRSSFGNRVSGDIRATTK